MGESHRRSHSDRSGCNSLIKECFSLRKEMGRAKLKLELIPQLGPKMLSFKKIKDYLKKKLEELTTLCDVKACMIIYGPDHAVEPEIYPDNLFEACRVIADYNSIKGESMTKCKSFGLSDFFKEKIKEVEGEFVTLPKGKVESKVKYPTWNETLESVLDPLVLRKIADNLNVKAQTVKSRIEFLKKEKAMVPNMDMCSSSSCTNMQQYNHFDGGLASIFQQPPYMPHGLPELQPQYMDFPMATNLDYQPPYMPDDLTVKAQIVKSRIEFLEKEKAMVPNMDMCSSSSCTNMQQYNHSSGGLASIFQQPPYMPHGLPELQPQYMDFPMATNLDYQPPYMPDDLTVKAQIVKSRIEFLEKEKAMVPNMDMCSSSSCTNMQQYNHSSGGLASSFQQPPYMPHGMPELQPQYMNFPMATNLQSQVDVNDYLLLEELLQDFPMENLDYYQAGWQ